MRPRPPRPPRLARPALAAALALSTVARAAAGAEPAAETAPAATTAPGGFASAEAGGGFGAVSQVALSLGATANEHFFFHKSGGEWQLQLAPAADYFLAPRFSVGGVVAYGHASGGAGTGTNSQGTNTFELAPRVGYVFDIDDRFAVWPLGGLSLTWASADHGSNTDTWLTAYVPVLFHLAPHFFVGAGPSARVHLSGNAATEWGLDSLLGGWF